MDRVATQASAHSESVLSTARENANEPRGFAARTRDSSGGSADALQTLHTAADTLAMRPPGRTKRALSIRQPYAEQIMRGVKRIDYRSRPTKIIGERFYIYASRQPGPPEEFASIDCQPGNLPTGVIVGSGRA